MKVMQPKATTTATFAHLYIRQHIRIHIHIHLAGRTPSQIIYAHILCIFPNVAHFSFSALSSLLLLTHSRCPLPKTQNRFAPESMQQSVKHAKGRHTDWCFNLKQPTMPLPTPTHTLPRTLYFAHSLAVTSAGDEKVKFVSCQSVAAGRPSQV